jgi:hypothetical protein
MPDPQPTPTPTPTPTPAPAPTPEPTLGQPQPTPAPTPAPAGDPSQLGDAGKRALDAEREARRQAEAAAAREKQRADELEKAQLSETDRLRKEAEEGKKLAQAGVTQMRDARLLVSLTSKGITGPKAQAAMKLLEGVQYDDAHVPTNLDTAIEVAKARYGAELFAGATPAPTPAPGPGATPPATPPPAPTPGDLHQGVRPQADQLTEDQKWRAFMEQNFPGVVPANNGQSAAT